MRGARMPCYRPSRNRQDRSADNARAAQTGCRADEGAGAQGHGPLGAWRIGCRAVAPCCRQGGLDAWPSVFLLAVQRPQGCAAETGTRFPSARLSGICAELFRWSGDPARPDWGHASVFDPVKSWPGCGKTQKAFPCVAKPPHTSFSSCTLPAGFPYRRKP